MATPQIDPAGNNSTTVTLPSTIGPAVDVLTSGKDTITLAGTASGAMTDVGFAVCAKGGGAFKQIFAAADLTTVPAPAVTSGFMTGCQCNLTTGSIFLQFRVNGAYAVRLLGAASGGITLTAETSGK